MEDYKKKYEDALSRAKEMCVMPIDKAAMEYVFPELNNDERVRRFLQDTFAAQYLAKDQLGKWHGEPVTNILVWLEKVKDFDKQLEEAYKNSDEVQYKRGYDAGYLEGMAAAKKELEKQGEQKSTDKAEPKFKVGDWIITKDKNVHKDYSVCKIVEIENKRYHLENGDYLDKDTLEQYGYRLWTIQDAKAGDVLFQDLMCGKTFIYNGVNPDMAILYSFIISNDGKDVLPYHIGKPNTGIGTIEENKNIIHPATKEQRELLFKKMAENGYAWDAEKKELSHKEVSKKSDKVEWSDEDQDFFGLLEGYLEFGYTLSMNEKANTLDWLKSIKQRLL